MVDLYTVDNPAKYQNIMEARIDEPYGEGGYSSYLKGGDKLGIGNILDPALIDDSESD